MNELVVVKEKNSVTQNLSDFYRVLLKLTTLKLNYDIKPYFTSTLLHGHFLNKVPINTSFLDSTTLVSVL